MSYTKNVTKRSTKSLIPFQIPCAWLPFYDNLASTNPLPTERAKKKIIKTSAQLNIVVARCASTPAKSAPQRSSQAISRLKVDKKIFKQEDLAREELAWWTNIEKKKLSKLDENYTPSLCNTTDYDFKRLNFLIPNS